MGCHSSLMGLGNLAVVFSVQGHTFSHRLCVRYPIEDLDCCSRSYPTGILAYADFSFHNWQQYYTDEVEELGHKAGPAEAPHLKGNKVNSLDSSVRHNHTYSVIGKNVQKAHNSKTVHTELTVHTVDVLVPVVGVVPVNDYLVVNSGNLVLDATMDLDSILDS